MTTNSMCLFIAVICIKLIKCSSFTYWRYGDGNFSNSLPQNNYLYSDGVFSERLSYHFKTHFNHTYFYPLITENNDIFVLSKNQSNEYNNVNQLNQTFSVSLIKLNQKLEQISKLHLISYTYETYSHLYYAYPIYHTNNKNDSYVVFNVAVNNNPHIDINLFNSYLFIINATTLNIISVSNTSFLADPSYPVESMVLINIMIHNNCIFQSIATDFSQYIYYILLNISDGYQIWNKTFFGVSGGALFSMITPIGVTNKIIATIPTTLYYDGFTTAALNISNGEILYTLPVNHTAGEYIFQPIIYSEYNWILSGFYTNPGFIQYEPMYLYIFDADNGTVIHIKQLTKNDYIPNDRNIYLSMNKHDEYVQLMVANFDRVANPCSQLVFALYAVKVKPNKNDANITIDLTRNSSYECVYSPYFPVQYLFMDVNGRSILGLIRNASNLYGNEYAIVTDDGQFVKNNISNQIWTQIQWDHYPAVGSNGLIYFAGINSIYAYKIRTDNKSDILWFIVGGAVLFVILIVVPYVIHYYFKCNCKKNTTQPLIQN
eukprot:125309_1